MVAAFARVKAGSAPNESAFLPIPVLSAIFFWLCAARFHRWRPEGSRVEKVLDNPMLSATYSVQANVLENISKVRPPNALKKYDGVCIR
jgi:hypothetical protein